MIESRQNNMWDEDYGMSFIEKPEDGMENQIQVARPIKKKKKKKIDRAVNNQPEDRNYTRLR